MKSIIITFITSFIILVNLNGQWEIVNDGSGVFLNVNAMDFTNDDIGWSAGENVIYQTKDGGNTWISLPISQGLNFNGIDFINDLVGWAVQDNGIYKTVDGGISWNQQTTSYYTLNKLCAITENVVYAAGGNSILKTSNGGSNWADISPGKEGLTYNSISFVNADTGIIASSPYIFRTFNGGASWDKKTIYGYLLFDVKILDDKVGYFTASNGADKYFLCKTTDTFNNNSVLVKSNYPVHDLHIFKNGVIISLMDDSTGVNIMKSEDGGLTWERSSIIKMPPEYWTGEMYFGSENVGYFIYIRWGGVWNIIMKSTDQGSTWTSLKLTYPFKDVCFIDRDKGFIVGGDPLFHLGSYGDVFETKDGGKNWYYLFNSDAASVNCLFTNDSNGFVSTTYINRGRGSGPGPLYQTMDGGDSWFENGWRDWRLENQICDIGGDPGCACLGYGITDIFFINERIGYLAGGGEIDKTLNGGESWEVIWKDTTGLNINSIYFIDESKGWAVGENGLIIKFSEQETWKQMAYGTDPPLNKVLFADKNTGWIAGGYRNNDEFHPILFKTENGGDSWNKIENPNFLIHDLYFKNTLEGWAVGEDRNGKGIIIVTNDGGTSWYTAIDNLSGPLHAIHFKDGIGWAVGDSGLILNTYDSTFTSLAENTIANNSNDILFQNYPNPFSSNTVIGYRLSVFDSVEISVCDLMGRKITTLVNEKQPAGSYEAEWNAEGIKPGVYFCELKAGQSRKVIKMIIIK